jgi:two-component system, NarL family, nitrate/nitrite response regulator NarL
MIRVFVAAPTVALRLALCARLDGPGIVVVGDGPTLDGAPTDVDVLVLGDTDRLPMSAGALPVTGARAVVALADDDRPARALRGMLLRGWAIVSREASAAELRAATTAAAEGFAVLPAPVATRLLPERVPLSDDALAESSPESLTPREREVLELLAQGLSNRQIGERLGISEHTAKFHVASLCGKLGAVSRTEAVSRGVRRGLLTL